MTKAITSGSLMVALLFLVGCAEPKVDRPTTYPVTGTVTLNGEPVADANVNFQLADGSGYAVGKTDEAGKYSLGTFESADGAVPGDYKVAISKYEGGGDGTQSADVDDEAYAPPEEGGASAKNLLPAKYGNAATSGFTATVVAGPNSFDFSMTE